MPLNALERRLRIKRGQGSSDRSHMSPMDKRAEQPPRRDRPYLRQAILLITCSLTAIFYAWLISFFVGFSLGVGAWIGIAALGALAGFILSIIL
ncbi:hypothetical protein [Salipiger mangrovisoli]|uniref:Uncharacterized protein n=1 Tax=Salipiger mangrovisoli TaxID=2865933 RepID=A0ABR9WZE0_9RHOB|nr:hypothetical protein [Salipiger mangrovisoli]MBE9636659.1 hypothetical protein [Salipiger mangrovisoli]